MPKFTVTRFRDGTRDEGDPHCVDAQNEQEAAEQVCGEPLVEDKGKPGQLRAEVWPEDKRGAKMKLFYTP